MDESTEFGKTYVKYRKSVWAFFPTLNSILVTLGVRKFGEADAKTK